MQEMNDVFKFVKLTHDLQLVKRRLWATGEDRQENDAEHSFQLGMLGWYLVSAHGLALDSDKVLKYGLVHDLVEAYAGDTFAYEQDESIKNSKIEREAAAAEKLKKEFADFEELHQYIKGYKDHVDKEAKFVYALDKIVPLLNIYLDKGRSWETERVTLDMILNYKIDKIAESPEAQKYFDQITAILKDQESALFKK